ncbi:MAG: hypothetical protein JXM69_15245 [Anaerolineae bacterium]|nr:hypothetical protein [Anaerolineae bacterium]
MTPTKNSNLPVTLSRILTTPSPDDLWELQAYLLELGGEPAHQARQVAGAFHSYLRDLASKVASRNASRWGAILATAAVSSVGLQEMIAEQEDPLQRLFSSGVTAMFEIGSAAKNVQAWEVEAALVNYDVAWYLYGELWDISSTTRPELPAQERRSYLAQLLKPVLDPATASATKSVLLVRLFQLVLAARIQPLLADPKNSGKTPGVSRTSI